MSFLSSYNSASIRGWDAEQPVGSTLQFKFDGFGNNAGGYYGSQISISNDGQTFSWSERNQPVSWLSYLPRYGSPYELSATMIYPRINGSGNIWIGRAGDTIPIRTLTANWAVTQTLTPSGTIEAGTFATINCISESGNVIIAGASSTGVTTYNNTCYVFIRSGSTYSQTQSFTLTGPAYPTWSNTEFPMSISGDSNILAIGCTAPGTQAGHVDIYVRSGNTYNYQTRLTPSDGGTNDRFGCSTSLNYDGSLLLIGAYNKSSGQGGAYLFKRSGTSWTQNQIITNPKLSATDNFGYSVSISSDSTAAAIGSPLEDTGGTNRGSGFVYFNVGNNFYYSQELTGSANLDYFGSSVATSNQPYYTTMFGAPGVDITGKADVGAVYIYAATGTQYIFT